ncbi:MAG TPA: PilW family protein [Woeseiaceae bacterium]|nr:PilW family protein [Woeseiaceae bacterium]
MNTKHNRSGSPNPAERQQGVTLIELMVALVIGSFLIIGAVQVYMQSRSAYIVNENIARVQENGEFAFDVIEPDLRMASYWGLLSRPDLVEGRATTADPDPLNINPPVGCGADFVTDLLRPIEGANNTTDWPCVGAGNFMPNSDSFVVRHARITPSAPTAGVIQLETTRLQGQLYSDGAAPGGFVGGGTQTNNLVVNGYYVSPSSDIFPNVPSLRRRSLATVGGAPVIRDEEVVPGVENMQVQFGLDMDGNATVDRYVNPDSPIIDPASGAFDPEVQVMAVRLWLLVRSVEREPGIADNTNYRLADVDLGAFNDDFRRMVKTKTILLRNVRT